jgi:hypothetical protein
MEPMQKYYMLKVENGGSSNAVHTTLESAKKRATDLARGTGNRVAILGVEFVVTPDMPLPENIAIRIEPVEEQS